MILLFIHASNFSFEVKQKATEIAEDPVPRSFSSQNTLVVFITVEKEDDNEIIAKALNDINDIISKTKPETLVIYPYAHLSSNLAEPRKAIEVLNTVYEGAKQKFNQVSKAPFGWYKAFNISCYGHPLSELSRRITKSAEYQKSKEMEVCSKFGFPSSPESTFMKIAVMERLRKDLKASGIIYGDNEVPGYLNVKFKKPEGRILPCVNEDPVIEVTYRGNNELTYPREFRDSVNSYVIWSNEGKLKVNVGNLLYYFLHSSREKSTPSLPLWLSPTHVRILRVREVDDVSGIASILSSRGIRVQIDDLNDSLGNKIRRAGMDWIPFVAIAGERELKTGSLTVRVRETSEQKPMTIDELEETIKRTDDLLIQSNLPVSMKELKSKNEKG
ncbi:threonyl-tRNA synthetase editing domain-containing protein [Metallosphaera hakonensis]|uniref:Ser-tRNA(Thr) hydrolase n=1 Tax=Metallosphaera hakonensis JCM 8857 = DSM 7519 TaxID=1293036 RepID=A0A2U9IVR4_9CREN|nr:threonyl-tRNA synthetase editing domain-containing protein [Metallosphaera hakonensis]AWS00074.1 Ser-tRNA(Thr) hydrolase [Metallosphaera hakonensis JCM 8857 = DSM 7519]